MNCIQRCIYWNYKYFAISILLNKLIYKIYIIFLVPFSGLCALRNTKLSVACSKRILIVRWGAQYVSGFTGLTIGTGVAGNSTNTFSLLGGVIRDEELYHTISNPQTMCRLGYKDGSNNWMKYDAADTTYAKIVGEPVYDNNGTLTAIPQTGGGRYGVIWEYATNRKVVKIVHIVGQGFYNTVALAQAAPQPTLYGHSTAEWKLLNRIIIRNVGGTLNWIQTDPLYNQSTGPAILANAVNVIPAGNVSLTPSGNITSENLEAAIYELDAEKQTIEMNILTAAVGAETYVLTTNKQTNILNALPSGVNSTLTLPTPTAGYLNESVLHFSTGGTTPTLVYSGFTPVWLGGTAITMNINKTYTIVFEQVRTATSTWIVKTSWGEY